ncbi:MAG: glutaredoxin 3 [Lysobacterales bacterium]
MKIEIYSKGWCPFCTRAKALLDRLGLGYVEYNVESEEGRLEEMLTRADGRRTVPQIFLDDRGIGGYTELYKLEQDGELTG